ncbi:MAG: methyl-accepting chemotaxis protein [Magnetococcus sp. DMHC-6]
MFKTMRLWVNILLGMGFTILLMVAAMAYTNMVHLEKRIREEEYQQLRAYTREIHDGIISQTQRAEAMSALVANLPMVQKFFADGEREALKKMFLPVQQILASQYDVEQFQFHTPPAISFLRLHKPEKFGDDLSSFRHTVVNTNQTQKPTQGLESGVAGLGARGIVPVFYEGRHLGSVEFGISIGQEYFDAFEKRYAEEELHTGLHLVDGEKFTTYTPTFQEGALLSYEELKRVISGSSLLKNVLLQGTEHVVYAEAVKDYSGLPIGVIEVALDRKAYRQTVAEARQDTIFVAGMALLFGLLQSLIMARTITNRLQRVVNSVNLVAQGDLVHEVRVEGRDEIATLARAAGEMRQKLSILLGDLEIHAINVFEAAHEIASSVHEQAANSNEMSSAVAEITSTMEELSASSTQIAEYSKTVVDIANQTWDSSKKGTEAMQTVVTQMGQIKRENQHSLEEIVALGGKSKEIGKVMEMINNIADQTKLIAFNAALEASSAGEAGRRFGVVASEIRRLADSVTDSTAEIEKKVGEIQSAINRLVLTSEKGATGIEEGIVASNHTSKRLTELVEAARQSSTAAQQISLSTQQQRTASNQVVIALREIVSSSSNSAQGVDRIAEIAQNMSLLSGQLKLLVGQFKLTRQKEKGA